MGTPAADYVIGMIDKVLAVAVDDLEELKPGVRRRLDLPMQALREHLGEALPEVAAAYAATNQVERALASACACVALLSFQDVLHGTMTALENDTATDQDRLALNACLCVLDARADMLYATVGEPTAPMSGRQTLADSVDRAWAVLDDAMTDRPTYRSVNSRQEQGSTSRSPTDDAAGRTRKERRMRCALCDHKGKFPQTGRSDRRKLYRCPRCKYDQYRSLFGQGQYVTPGTPLELHEPAETSVLKMVFEKGLVDRGLMHPNDVTRPGSEDELRKMFVDNAADSAESAGKQEVAEFYRKLVRDD